MLNEQDKKALETMEYLELQQKALRLISNALQEAEMRQGCSNHEYYADILLEQLEPIIFQYAPSTRILKKINALQGI